MGKKCNEFLKTRRDTKLADQAIPANPLNIFNIKKRIVSLLLVHHCLLHALPSREKDLSLLDKAVQNTDPIMLADNLH